MSNSRSFAVFILSHGRPDSVLSYKALRTCGYTGKIYVIADTEDKCLDHYRSIYEDDLKVFYKKLFAKSVDACDNYGRRDSVVYARNYSFELAKDLGLTHHLQLDDDYLRFGWTIDGGSRYLTSTPATHRLDAIFKCILDFLDFSGCASVAFAQGGDFIGGEAGTFAQKGIAGQLSRKAMNSFFFRTDDPSTFRGRVNDDVNLYVEDGRRGRLFLTIQRLRLWQPQTQKNAGGCTDVYLDLGTYIKSFYSLMVAPSCIKIAMMGHGGHRRIHHRVSWKHACPVIVDEKHRKPRPE